MVDIAAFARSYSHSPAGIRIVPDEIEVREAREAEAHRHAYRQNQAEVERGAAVMARVRSHILTGPSLATGTSGTAKERLLQHVAWTNGARRQSDAAKIRQTETQQARATVESARQQIEDIRQAVDDAYGEWVKFDVGGQKPPNRSDEIAALIRTVSDNEAAAKRADEAMFEADVAHRCVAALEIMLPTVQRAVVHEQYHQPNLDRIRDAAVELRSAFGAFAALDELLAPGFDEMLELQALGVTVPQPSLTSRKVTGPLSIGFEIEADDAAMATYRGALLAVAVPPAAPPPQTGLVPAKTLLGHIKGVFASCP